MIEGIASCSDCGKEFEWYYWVPQYSENRYFKVFVRPKNKQSLEKVIRQDNGTWAVSVRSSCCDVLNFFSIKEYTNEKV